MKFKHSNYIIVIMVGIISNFVSAIFMKNTYQSIIVGLLFCIISILVDFRETIHKNTEVTNNNKELLHSIKQLVENLLDYSNIKRSYLKDNWLNQVLKEIIKFTEITKQKSYSIINFKNTINEALKYIEREINEPYRSPKDFKEFERISKLNEIFKEATEYIYAVTFDTDKNNYFNQFWTDVFSEEYIQSNLAASKRGVKIERIFVIEKKFINRRGLNSSDDKNKFKKIQKTIRDLEVGENITIYKIALEDLPADLTDSNTSFLICDDCMVSESEGLSNGIEIPRYLYCGEDIEIKNVIERLKARFKSLKECAKSC